MRSTRRRSSTAALVLLASFTSWVVAGARVARAEVEGPRIQLSFVPQENLDEVVADITPAMKASPVAVAVEDGRTVAAKDLVGTVQREGVRANLRAGNDIVVFALGALLQSAGQRGLPVAQGTAGAGGAAGRGRERLLTVRLTRFEVEENVRTVGSTYAAEVNALFRLSVGGRLVYEGVGAGAARRYGKSENEENASEVLSDALKEAYAKGLSDAGLHAAWTAPPPPSAAGAPPILQPSPAVAPRRATLLPPAASRAASLPPTSSPISRSSSARDSPPTFLSTTSTSAPSPRR